jgi:hypothetical protein
MSKSTKAIKGGKQSGKPAPKKGGPTVKTAPQKKLWEWADFTSKSVAFQQEAKKLAQMVTATYGDNVTISRFEKMIAAYPSMPEDRKQLIHVSDELIGQYEKFKAARDTRDTERDSFRGDIAVANVEGGLEAIKESMRA